MEIVRIAVIGAGRLGNAMHYPSLTSMDDFEIVDICGLDVGHLNSTGERFGIGERFRDYHEMLGRTQPDAVFKTRSRA